MPDDPIPLPIRTLITRVYPSFFAHPRHPIEAAAHLSMILEGGRHLPRFATEIERSPKHVRVILTCHAMEKRVFVGDGRDVSGALFAATLAAMEDPVCEPCFREIA
jgi:hypothetical protein